MSNCHNNTIDQGGRVQCMVTWCTYISIYTSTGGALTWGKHIPHCIANFKNATAFPYYDLNRHHHTWSHALMLFWKHEVMGQWFCQCPFMVTKVKLSLTKFCNYKSNRMEGVKTYSFHCKKFFHLDVLTIIFYLCSLANACMCNLLTVIFDILFLKVTYLLQTIALLKIL